MISHTPAAGLDASDGTPGLRRISAAGLLKGATLPATTAGIAITDPKTPAGIGD
jgi:hypothetical protein